MTNNDDNVVKTDIAKDLVPSIGRGQVIPVISNAFRIEQIFREDEELSRMMSAVPQFYDEFRTFAQQLTKKWAASINYPMSDDHNLARVAQYQYSQVEKGGSIALGSWEDPREKYIQFLVGQLLTLSEKDERYKSDEEYRNVVSAFRKTSRGKTHLFSEVATQLGYPRFMEGFEDPLRLLARLPVKIYITTSYSNFLERALEKEGKTPRTQVCFSAEDLITDADHLPDREFKPTEKNPAVVHLFGLEDYIETLVLSEDDYINFLMNAAENYKLDDMFPSYLRLALPKSSLALLGYHLREWDFRTLFRFISRIRNINDTDKPSIAIQFRPSLGKKEEESRSLKYLETYLNRGKFMVEWTSADRFIYKLWAAWEAWNA